MTFVRLRQELLIKFEALSKEAQERIKDDKRYEQGYARGMTPVSLALKKATQIAKNKEMLIHHVKILCLIAMQEEVKSLWDYVKTTETQIGVVGPDLIVYNGRADGALNAYHSIMRLIKIVE